MTLVPNAIEYWVLESSGYRLRTGGSVTSSKVKSSRLEVKSYCGREAHVNGGRGILYRDFIMGPANDLMFGPCRFDVPEMFNAAQVVTHSPREGVHVTLEAGHTPPHSNKARISSR